MIKIITKNILFLIIIYTPLIGQLCIPADPFDYLKYEKEAIDNRKEISGLSLRPTFISNDETNKQLFLKFRSEAFFNSNVPNLENMSDRWIGRGLGLFSSINISYKNDFLLFSLEPYYFFDQNNEYDVPIRIPLLSQLNDNNGHHTDSPYQKFGIREFQIFAHLKGVGMGISNTNMWWGPGIHSSLIMTNNTSGFPYFFLGTVEEKRHKNIGYIARYIFSKFDERNTYTPFYTSFVFNLTYYAEPSITFGLTRSALTGGTFENSDDVRWYEAALSILSGVTAGDVETYKDRWSYDDHTVSGYISTYFHKSKLTVFLELGRNDIAWDIYNMILAPDHSLATVFGFRKYGLFKNANIFFGMEYAKLFSGRYIHRLFVGPWYNREGYEFSSYNGRHFGAHSGPDSDDFYIFLGWKSNNWEITPSFNYERHGVQEPMIEAEYDYEQTDLKNSWPEVKTEFRIDIRYLINEYKINLYLEHDTTNNLEFKNKTRKGFVLWVGVEKDIEIDKLFNVFSKH